MHLTWKAEPLTMQWCLECHRDPAPHIRPREYVFDTAWEPEGDPRSEGESLMAQYGVQTEGLSDCTVCHR